MWVQGKEDMNNSDKHKKMRMLDWDADGVEGKHFMKVYLIIAECWLYLNVWIMQHDTV